MPFMRKRRRLSAAGSLVALAIFAGPVSSQTAPARFSFDAATSEIHWRVYKAGAFARFGHNHVISVAAPQGVVYLAEPLADSRVEIMIPFADLEVDDPALRARYGDDFASVPSADDIAGTRRNMMTEAVLNGEQFSELAVIGTAPSGLGADQTIDLEIHLLGRVVNVTVPLELQVESDMVHAAGAFRLTHEQLGMMPFSVMMGALQVANEMDFTFDIRAVRVAD
jgi:hypothetical protein